MHITILAFFSYAYMLFFNFYPCIKITNFKQIATTYSFLSAVFIVF